MSNKTFIFCFFNYYWPDLAPFHRLLLILTKTLVMMHIFFLQLLVLYKIGSPPYRTFSFKRCYRHIELLFLKSWIQELLFSISVDFGIFRPYLLYSNLTQFFQFVTTNPENVHIYMYNMKILTNYIMLSALN